ncbi:hypothetical protein E2C01_019222 [Portunus trituberculatus]|uniref:Uncharacterized protein n=1 Tax=Portunus trituberculatus TaxID=210409 RepID=A0A5B7DWP9_PORTR|nr:hypothetical protein [Portunus trituberculatus]
MNVVHGCMKKVASRSESLMPVRGGEAAIAGRPICLVFAIHLAKTAKPLVYEICLDIVATHHRSSLTNNMSFVPMIYVPRLRPMRRAARLLTAGTLEVAVSEHWCANKKLFPLLRTKPQPQRRVE